VTTGGHGILAASADSRDDMIRALQHPDRTVIGAIVSPRMNPSHFIAFSRALVDRAGRVQGVAVIMVDTNGFNAFHHQLQAPDQGSIFTVARQDGALIARFPMPDESHFHFDTTKHPFTEFAKGSEGTYRASSVVDGMERLIAFRHLRDLDLVATAGMTMDMVFHDWTARTQRNATLFAGGTLLLLILTLVTSESLRHEARLLHSVESKADELANALSEKDVLFQEVHHRVKNNLQVISSLLTMQSLHVGDDRARATLKDALDRIQSMGLVHQTLYERNLASNVDLGVYFGRLAEALVGSYGQGQGSVSVQVEVEGSLDLDRAVPLGMLANEALSNSLKHAFPDGRSGSVSISLTRDDSMWHFTIRDDGVGMPSKPSKGIGLSLIKALTRQLNGRSAVTRDGGTVVIVTFPV
jgi:two-component sensor histidine kinase